MNGFKILTKTLDSLRVMSFLKVVESVDDVLKSVHVISVNVPISEVPVAGVLNVPDVILHDLPGDVLPEGNVPLQHGHLQLTQHRLQLVLGLVELLDELPVEERLVQHDLLEPDREPLQVVVDIPQR